MKSNELNLDANTQNLQKKTQVEKSFDRWFFDYIETHF
jgi:hypothetical protein